MKAAAQLNGQERDMKVAAQLNGQVVLPADYPRTRSGKRRYCLLPRWVCCEASIRLGLQIWQHVGPCRNLLVRRVAFNLLLGPACDGHIGGITPSNL